MKLIVGLGNNGKGYENTRHNLGFLALDSFAKEQGILINKKKMDGIYGDFIYGDEKVILLKPQKYMNLSGEVVKKYIDFFKISIEDILIISDDLDMPVGKIKLKYKGSSGGHNGLNNIESHIHSKEYKRLKIGIANDKAIETTDYVLGKFTFSEQKKINEIMKIIPQIISDYLTYDFDNVMNKYNKKES